MKIINEINKNKAKILTASIKNKKKIKKYLYENITISHE